ncbi:MAG: YkvA family protein, partial [Bacteroidota bacterium]
GALIYFVNPFDAVPDLIPAAGLLDDATVIGFVIASVKQDIDNYKKLKCKDFSEDSPFVAFS